MEKSFGENLKRERQLAGLSQKQLAEKLNISFKTISHWENGYSEPGLIFLKKIKETLHVSYEDLID